MRFWRKSSTFHQLLYGTKTPWGGTASEAMSEGKACQKTWENPFIFQAVCMRYLFYESCKPFFWWVEEDWLMRLTLLALCELPLWGSVMNFPSFTISRACLIYTIYLLLYGFHWSQWKLCAWSQGQNLAQKEYNSSSALPNEIHLESDMHSWMQSVSKKSVLLDTRLHWLVLFPSHHC